MLKLPLLGGFFAGVKKALASGSGRGAACWLAGTVLNGAGEDVGSLPETGTGQEAVFQAGAGYVFEINIVEVEVGGGACVLVCQVDTGDAFVIGGECHGNA